MEPTLSTTAGVYFLAEAPGRDEDEDTGKPLTGPSGTLLRECIPEGEEEFCSYDNVINCRPPQNRAPVWAEIESCRPRRWKWIEEAKPKLIVGLGVIPLQWMLNSTDMAGMRGRFFAVKVGTHTCWFLPTYHPSFILKTAFDKRKPLQSKMGHCFRMDIRRAFEELKNLGKPHVDTEADVRKGIQCFDGTDRFDDLVALLRKAKAAPLKAVDLETKGLRPFSTGAAVMTAAISYDDVNFSFAMDHPKAKWQPQQKAIIKKHFRELLEDRKSIKIAHNAPFELEWFIWMYGKEVVDHAGWECTQMQAHILDERRGKQFKSDSERRATYQDLDFLIKQHFGISYKSQFKLNKKDMSQADLGETLIYNGADTKYDLRLFHRQHNLLGQKGLHKVYLDSLPRQPTVALMQSMGIGVNQATNKRFREKLESEIKPIEAEIKSLKVVKAFIADKGAFNPASDKDVLAIFKDYLHRPEVVIAAEGYVAQDDKKGAAVKRAWDSESRKERFSVDKNVLEKIDHPLANLVVTLRNRAKLKSTYADGLQLGVGDQVYPDGLIHCNFNTTFTETGRTSSDDPNLQNFPQRNDAWVREQVEGGKGNVLISFDFGQLQACTAAMCSKDKVLVKALWEDYDIHMEWSEKTAALYPEIIGGREFAKDKDVMRKLRAKVKNKLVFPAIFGAHDTSIAGYLNIPEHIVSELMDEFWKSFYGLHSWQDRLMKGYYADGYVESFVGRRRYYPLTRNQAINHPVQCLEAEIVSDAMNRLSMLAASTGQWHLHPRLNIHDDLTFVVPDNDKIIEDSINTIYRIMLTPPYECVNVPLSVKASVGNNWYKMEEVGVFWSHKDL